MLPSSNINIDSRYQPQGIDHTCHWLLPQDFNENTGLACLGNLQEFLKRNDIYNCEVSFAEVTWADPQPLLCFGLVLAESGLEKSQIILDLGKIVNGNRDHLIFLKFLANQGFLTEFGFYAQFSHDGSVDDNIEALRFDLAHKNLPSHFFNADCIHAKIVRVDQYQNDQASLQKKVEDFFREAKERSGQNAFSSDPFAREVLFQKIRKLLYELLLNVVEHSHPDGEPNFAGIYARVRAAKPPVHRDAQAWVTLFEKKTTQIFGQRTFTPNHYTEWLELFVCDVGVGLTHNIQNWSEPKDDPVAAKILRNAKKKKYPFLSLVDQLFHAPFSKHSRHGAERTAVTGLQHLGHLLSWDSDHCRIYTERGSWAGDHFPWQGKEFSKREIRNPKAQENKQYVDLTPVSGTFYAFSLQPDHRNVTDDPPWELLDLDGQNQVLEALKERTIFEEKQVRVAWYDHRDEGSCPTPQLNEYPDHALDAIVLLPPQLMNKQDIAKWLELVAGHSLAPAKTSTKLMILADLTPFQTLIFRELLKHVVIHKDTTQDWHLVSEQWAVCSLTTIPGERSLKPSTSKAREFCLKTNSQLPFTVADLAILLRQIDSENFWKPEGDYGQSPFFDYPVVWESTHDGGRPIKLERYLDFPVALIKPDRYQACLRALKRCLALFPEYNPVAADDLVTSLVRETSPAYRQQTMSEAWPDILIGSVAVTGKTVETLLPSDSAKSLHVLNHHEVEEMPTSNSLVALLWISQLPNHIGQPKIDPDPAYKPWRRIPYTPYIAPLGEKSISVLRYRKNDDGSLNFNNPYYGRTPEDTYNDFQRLGILKSGHWKYGSRHDLLTINMRLAFRFSFREHGPLYNWLADQFRELFYQDSKINAQFLLYPSHPVTDSLFDRIRRDPGFKEIQPEGGMIPIKFIGKRTVSPLLASHLVKYRINQMLEQKNWKEQKWKAVIFDDGTISGKHLRETTQFLQALGASYVYLIAVLDRTGLPVQEEVYDNFFKKHKRFWRWDVPGLGNKRNCPLCQALAIVQTYSQKVTSDRQAMRLKEWTEIWEVRDVDSEWYQGGLQPTIIDKDPPFKITFGIDPIRSTAGSPVEKRLSFSSSTNATSLLMELTRLTTRTDVTLKKAEYLLPDYPDAAIEMIASQLFLFMDELSPKEKLERFKKLLEWPWAKERDTDAMSFAGLCLTLSDDKFVKTLWGYCRDSLFKDRLIRNLDTILSVSILCSRYEFLTGQQYKPSGNINDIEVQNYLLLSRRGNLCQDIGALLARLISNPDNPCQANSHQTEIKKRIDQLCDMGSEDCTQIGPLTRKIAADVSQLIDIISRLQQEYVLKLSENILNQLSNVVEQLINEAQNPDTGGQQSGKVLQGLLYGSSNKTGIVKEIQNQLFIYTTKDGDEFNIKFIAPYIRSLQNKWQEIIDEHLGGSDTEWSEMDYWSVEEGDYEEPVILQSQNNRHGCLWFYCDRFCKKVIEDILANVIYATDKIADPFIRDEESSMQAHLWWSVEVEEQYFIFKTANATKNKEIFLKQRVPVSCSERIGGKVKTTVDDNQDPFITYTSIYLPLFNFFLGEK